MLSVYFFALLRTEKIQKSPFSMCNVSSLILCDNSYMLIKSILDLIYPDSLYCICCSKLIDDSRPYKLCNDCMAGIKWSIGPCCKKCGKPLSPSNPMDTCFSCREHSHFFRKGYTVTEYGSFERSLVFALKYHARTDIALSLGEMIYDKLSRELQGDKLREEYDLIVPIPMYEAKKMARGYNQAELIARAVAKHSLIEYHGDILQRTRETVALRGLSPEQRRLEIKGAFAFRQNCEAYVRGARVLLVDDIYTTGASCDEVAKLLLEHGAASVDIASFAAGADVVKGFDS